VAQDPDTLLYGFDWGFQDGGTGNSFSIVHTFPSAGAYDVQLTVSNHYGCRDVISKNIKVFDYLKVPNVFTPNQDGYNDYFKVRTNGTNTYSFIVYSKTGAMLYRSESPVISWDGRSMFGHELKPGIYYYVIRQIDGEDPEELSGFIHLIR